MKKVYDNIDYCFKEKLNCIVIGTGEELNKISNYIPEKYNVCALTYYFDETKEMQLLFIRPNTTCALSYATDIKYLLDNPEDYKDFIKIDIKTIKEQEKMKNKIPTFKIGDRVQVITKKSKYYGFTGTIFEFGLNDIIVRLDVPGGSDDMYIPVHFRNPASLEHTELVKQKFQKLNDKIKKEQSKIANRLEWRPKKGEKIEVSVEGNVFYPRNFKVFVDGMYWCYYNCSPILFPFKYARPIQKVEPKFKIGDVVKYNSATSSDLAGRVLKNGDKGRITKTSKKTDIWYAKFEKYDIYLQEILNWELPIEEKNLEKVPTIPIKEGTISFRGKSKGIMVDENIVMYYSHKYKRILMSEAETPLKKKYVLVKVDIKDLQKGDIITFHSEGNCGLYIFFTKSEVYQYDSIDKIPHHYNYQINYTDSIYKVIEV